MYKLHHQDYIEKVMFYISVQFQALNFALEGAQQFSPGKGHFYGGKCKFVLELCKGHHSKSTGHPRQLLWVQWVNSRPAVFYKCQLNICLYCIAKYIGNVLFL